MHGTKMRLNKTFIGVVGGIALAGVVVLVVPVKHIGPDYLYPNPSYTTGKYDTLVLSDIVKRYNGLTYSQSHRNVSEAEKKLVLEEYGNPTGKMEIDHFYPVAIGGSNDIGNLWPQPEVNSWNGKDYGFHAKDKLESLMVSQVKSGIVDPQDAYDCIVKDWVACYDKYIQESVSGIGQFDEDDDII